MQSSNVNRQVSLADQSLVIITVHVISMSLVTVLIVMGRQIIVVLSTDNNSSVPKTQLLSATQIDSRTVSLSVSTGIHSILLRISVLFLEVLLFLQRVVHSRRFRQGPVVLLVLSGAQPITGVRQTVRRHRLQVNSRQALINHILPVRLVLRARHTSNTD